jgi:hypothetical protein
MAKGTLAEYMEMGMLCFRSDGVGEEAHYTPATGILHAARKPLEKVPLKS